MTSTWWIRPYAGEPVPERLSRAEQRAIQKATGVVVQRPGIPGAVVHASDGRPVLALSGASEVRFARGAATTSTAEVLTPVPPGGSWPARGRVEHDGVGWTTWRHEALDGTLLGSGDGGPACGQGPGWGLWAGTTVTVGAQVLSIEDLVRPESVEERSRRERRRFFRSEKFAGRALGHRLLAADGTELGRLTWVGDEQPQHHDRPYEWQLEWIDDRPNDAVFVGAIVCALRFMAYTGTMLSTS